MKFDLTCTIKFNVMYKYKAKVTRVVDGDTMDVTIDLGFKITTHQRIRLKGINTPETYSVKKGSEEYIKGMASKQFVIDRIKKNKDEVIVETNKDTGKYGRYIGDIWLADNNISLNVELVENGLAEFKEY